MVRTVEKKYQIWLAGYYDDFNGARAIPDDRNQPTDSSYSALKSHFGNPMNGEAFINPRFRFSIEERLQDSAKQVATPAPTGNQYLQNDGIFEWLSLDDTRLNFSHWEGRAQLQYPDGHIANRYKFDNDSTYGSDFYQRFINGHNSDASYIVPVGDNDATFGHANMKDYDTTNYNADEAGLHSTTGDFVQRAHLTGVWMGEQLEQDSTTTTPRNIFQEIHSPSKQPFLCIQAARKNDTQSATTPSLIYDGPLNTRLDGDIFTARIALQSMITTGAWTDVGVRFEVGFALSQAGILNDSGYTGTPAIDFTLDLSDISYDTQAYLGGTNFNTPQVTIDDAWVDVDFVLDYTNNKFKAYYNGTEITSTNATAGAYSDGYTMSGGSATTASNLYGYQLTVTNEGSGGTFGFVSYLMIDRVGLVRYLTDDFTTTEEVQIQELQVRQNVNGISICNVKVADDPDTTGGVRGAAAGDYLLNLRGLFVASTPLDWSLLVFADSSARIDRPVWRGEVDNFQITQGRNRSRILTFSAKDSVAVLDRQLPLWDVGQKGANTTEDTTDYWAYDAQGFRDIMNLGAGKLKLLSGDVGFDKDSSYEETSTQRMQLDSGHPIQMYNNEDETFGPNSIEDNYESFNIIGFTEDTGTTDYTIAIAESTGHGISASDTVTVIGENYDEVSATVHSVNGAEIKFTAAQLTYYPETAKIVYIGKYPGRVYDFDSYTLGTIQQELYWNNVVLASHPASTDFTPSGPTYMNVYFNADPNLSSGDYFYINRRDDAGTSNLDTAYHGRHRVSSVIKIRSYFDSFGTTTSSALWLVATTTPYGGSESFGDYENDALLTASSTPQRFSWSKEIGTFSDIYGTNGDKVRYRATHAVWMRDLPHSLWFKYHFGVVKEDAVNKSTQNTSVITTGQAINSSTKTIEISQAAYDAAPTAGVAEIWTTGFTPTYVGKFIYQGKRDVATGNYLNSCKFINFTVNTTTGSHALRFQDFEDDYKHIWLLWADMRNNGEADADGSERKSTFGLQYPIDSNYKFDLFYADQTDADGNIDKFATLKAGEDIHVWEIDSTTDPITNIAFSKPANYSGGQVASLANSSGKLQITVTDGTKFGDGSGNKSFIHLVGSVSHDGGHEISGRSGNVITTTTDYVGNTADHLTSIVAYPPTGSEAENATLYADWENKGGALLVIDAAKFFNLNTHINSGKTGQTAGGSTDLSDYITTLDGHPSLIDNYWAEAISSYKTVDSNLVGVDYHPAQRRLISDATLASDGFVYGYMGLPVDDASIFEDSGAGRLVAVMNRTNNEDNTIQGYFIWDDVLRTEYSSSSGIDSTINTVTFQNQPAVHITNAGEGHAAGGITAGMVLKRTPNGGGDITTHNIIGVGDPSGGNTDTDLVIIKDAVDGTSVTWATGDTYTIPIQLAKIYTIPLDDITDDATVTASQSLTSLEDAIWAHYRNQQVSWNNYGIKTTFTTASGEATTPKITEVHSTVYSNYMLRLLMHINGFYEKKNGGTYWDSDKLRMLWNAAIMDTWLPSAKVNAIFDINNVPITKLMTTYNDTSTNDTFGSIVDTRGKTLGAALQQIQEKSGYGSTSSNYVSFSYLIGRDNRLEFRPKYNSGLTLDRNNIDISSIKTNLSGQITNVRVYYNSGKAFVDWPTTSLSDSTRWKIIEHPKTIHSGEALILAQQEYNKRKNNALKLNVTPILEGDVSHKMIESGRYGYIADPYIALVGHNDTAANVCNWTILGTGGCLFPGMVNALNGNMNTDIDPLKSRYGQSQNTTSSGDVAWADNYYWYGSNSISHAVQVVHVPNGTPLTNSDGFSMRMWVDLKNQTGTNIDDAEFVITLADYSFTAKGRTAQENGTSTKDVKHSGYYEIDIPSSYDSGSKKLVISFNAEYCRALLRHRCGDPTISGILDSSVDNGSGSTNDDSIFPLGKRPYTEMGGGFRNQRLIWYAPRVQICRDLSYVPATYASVTDAGLQLSSENMVIQDVNWSVKTGRTEEVTLTMERDESLSSDPLMSYLFPTNTGSNQVGSSQSGGNPFPSWPNTVDSLIPPSNTSDALTDPSGQSPSGGYEQQQDAWMNNIVNGMEYMDSETYGRFMGRMDLPSDDFAGNATFSVLGQKPPAITPSVMKGIEGIDVDIRATSGTASLTGDGYTFAGKGLMGSESNSTSQETTIETTFLVPTDVLSNQINIKASVTHSPLVATDKTAVLYITALIEETGQTITDTVRIGTGVNRSKISLLQNNPLSGLNVAGRHVKITITRKAGVGDDDADTTSVTLHNLDIKMQRAVAHSRSLSSHFSTNS